MRKSKFTEQRIIKTLKQAEAGRRWQRSAAKPASAMQEFHRWRAKFGGMEATDAQRRRDLEDENRKLKRWSLTAAGRPRPEGRPLGRVQPPGERRQAAEGMVVDHHLSERRAWLTGLHRSTKRYRVRRDRQHGLRAWRRELAEAHLRYGYRRLWVLLRRERKEINSCGSSGSPVWRLVSAAERRSG